MAVIPAQSPPRVPPAETIEQRFRRLEAQWQADTQYLSDAQLIINHPAFQQIIGLGREVVPFMLHDLQTRPTLWVWALPKITGQDPVPAGDAGNIRRMSDAWVQWGLAQGHLR